MTLPTDASDQTDAANTLCDADLPVGFRYASAACGIKPSRRPDLALVTTEAPATVAGVYTQNRVVAAPVVLSRQRTPQDGFRGLVVNSGNANACTGSQGDRDAQRMTDTLAQHLGCRPEQVLVMSTGIIGKPLPIESIERGIGLLAKNGHTGRDAFLGVAEAIKTTDATTKVATCRCELTSGDVKIAAVAKGAGMIEPNMATMLSMVMTDASLSPDQAQALIHRSADQSLNRISVDGHCSTNDTLLLIASGSGEPLGEADANLLCQNMTDALIQLGKMIVADGEGAQHFMELEVSGAATDGDAEKIARAIGNSALVKTAITGNDPNWGRIVSAAGNADVAIEPGVISLRIFDVSIYADGQPCDYDATALSDRMRKAQQVDLAFSVGQGPGHTRFWASDLTADYVAFNSEYTT